MSNEIIYTLFPEFLKGVQLKCREEKGFSIEYKSNKGVIEYARKCDLSRAVTLLNYAVSNGVSEFKLSETPNFDTLGVMIDVSRGAVLTVETVKDIIKYLARMGYNRMMLYTEDTFLVEPYPYFGYMRGAYTEDELREIDEYASAFGIECVPCLETLSHMEHILRWSVFGGTKNSQRTLLVGAEETYTLIEEMIKTVRRCFKTNNIHLGMDEAADMADGRYRMKNGARDSIKVFNEHLGRVVDICRKYDFKPMIWHDMYFHIHSKTHFPCDPTTEFPRETIEAIPEDVSVVFWDYSNNDSSRTFKMINAVRRLEHPVIFAGGIWTMNGFTPNYDMTFTAGMTAIKGCIDAGQRDVFVTMWGDNGGECNIYSALLGIQMYAEGCYASDFTVETVYDRFKMCTGFDAVAFDTIGVDRYPTTLARWHNGSVSKQVIYSDLLMGLYDYNFAKFDIKAHFEDYKNRIEALPVQKGLEYLFDYYTKHHQMLAVKCDMGIRLAKAYKNGDKKALAETIPDMYDLLEKYREFHKAFCNVWLRTNKPQGLECIDFRLGGIESRINTAIDRVKAYLDGEISEIPELAEERRFFAHPGQVEDYPLFSMWNMRAIFSASEL